MRATAILLCAVLAVPAFAAPRSQVAKRDFARQQACPATAANKLPCPGFIIDHKTPLDCGGPDTPANMQWLTVQAWKGKSKWERNGPNCKHRTKGVKP